jgi:hypothetical protein
MTIAIFDDLHDIEIVLFPVHHPGLDGIDATDTVGRVDGKVSHLEPFGFTFGRA